MKLSVDDAAWATMSVVAAFGCTTAQGLAHVLAFTNSRLNDAQRRDVLNQAQRLVTELTPTFEGTSRYPAEPEAEQEDDMPLMKHG